MNSIQWLKNLARDPFLYLLAAASVLLLTLAYQVPMSPVIDVGAQTDRPFVFGFNDPDIADTNWFRWSKRDSSIVLPDLGGYAAGAITLRMRGYRPDGIPPRMTLTVNGEELTKLSVQNEFRDYVFQLPPSLAGLPDLRVEIQVKPFSTENDKRPLGIMIDTLGIDPPQVWRPVIPAWTQIVWGMLGVLSIYVLLQLLAFSRRFSLAAAMSVLVLSSIGIGWFRLWLVPSSQWLVLLFWLASIFGLVVFYVLRRLYVPQAPDREPAQRAFAWLTLIFVFGFWFAYAGLTHPDFVPVDQLLRAHLLGELIRDEPRATRFYFTEPQSDAWGGSFVLPYPPTLDIVLAPIRGIIPEDNRLVPFLNLVAALLYSSSIFPLYALALKMVPGETRAGLLAALAWVVMPLNFLPLSDGVYPNLFGQWLALIFLAALAEYYTRLTRPRIFAACTILLFFTFMAYSPTLLYLVITLVIFIGLRLLWGHAEGERKYVGRLVLVVVCALSGAVAVYYGGFAGAILFGTIPTMLTRLSSAGTVGHSSFMGGSWILPRELIAHFRLFPVVLTLVTPWVMRPLTSPARWIFVASLLAFIPFGIGENWINFYNKHMLSLLPMIAIGTGITLAALSRRGWIGLGFTVASMGYLMHEGFVVWFQRVFFYILPPGSGVENPFGN